MQSSLSHGDFSCLTVQVTRIVQVSDSHLSPNAPYADENWNAVLDHLDRDPPALVIHTGDISLNGADGFEDLQHARRQLNRIGLPWLAIPGNHDIGDFGDAPQPVNEDRRERYAAVFGGDRWSIRIDDWRLIGLDIQTLVSELPAATEMWDWLAGHLESVTPTALWLHRPLQPTRTDEVDDPNRYIPQPARDRLRALLAPTSVRLIATGHVHQWRLLETPCRQVWAPSTWAALPDRIQPVIGSKIVGLVEHDLHADGTVTSTLVQPRSIAEVTIGDDFPSPYQH